MECDLRTNLPKVICSSYERLPGHCGYKEEYGELRNRHPVREGDSRKQLSKNEVNRK